VSERLPTPKDETVELSPEAARPVDETAKIPAADSSSALASELDSSEILAVGGAFDETVELDSIAAGGGSSRRDGAPASKQTDMGKVPREFSSERYRVVRELGRGGMGVVLEAFDKRLERRVALKILLSGDLAGSDALERFQLEARAAARLSHPNLVSVHEVGEEEGRPYLVMDYVEGESLAARIRRDGPLDPRAAADVAYCLAEALYVAHVRGILHRDVKPANVLVTKEGKPLLTDFGLAKEIESGRENITESGYVVGTPAYMSPEQALGHRDQLDRRSDVYGIGATLYETLTGKPPFVAPSLPAVLDKVVKEEPVSPRILRAEVDRDIETICLKCLEKEPEARYASAKDLAADLARYLANESIQARPPRALERGRKWLKRNSLMARTLGFSLGLSLLAGVGGTAWFMHRLDAERRAAESAAQEAALALDLLVVDVQSELGDLPGARVRRARQRLLSKALERLLALREHHLQALRSSEASRQLTQIALQAGEGEHARRLAEETVTNARAVQRGEIGKLNTALSLLVLGDVDRIQGQAENAKRNYREAIELLDTIKASASEGTAEAPRHRVEAYVRLAGHLERLDELEESTTNARRALELARELPRGESFFARSAAADALGRVLERRMELDEALACYREGIEASREAVRDDPKSVQARTYLMISWSHLARIRRTRGKLQPSVEANQEALRMANELLRADPESLSIQRSKVSIQVDLADSFEALGQTNDSVPLLKSALDTNRQLVASDPEGIDSRILCTSLSERLATLLAARGDQRGAMLLLREQIRLAEEVLSRSSHHREAQRALCGALGSLGQLHIRRGELDKGLQRLDEVIALRRELVQVRADREARLELSTALVSKADVLRDLGRLDEARKFLVEGQVIRRELLASKPEDIGVRQSLARACSELVDIERDAEDAAAALKALKEGLEVAGPLRQAAPDHASSRQVLATLAVLEGTMALEAGEPERARPALTEAVKLRRALLVNNAQDIAAQRALGRALSRLADLELAEGRQATARDLYSEVLKTQRARLQQHPDDAEVRRDLLVGLVKLSDLLVKEGDLEGTAKRLKEADAVGRDLLRLNPSSGAALNDRLVIAARLAQASEKLGRKTDALKAYKDAANLSGIVLEKAESMARRRNLSVFWLKVADLTREFGDEFGSRAYLERAVKNHAKVAAADPRYASQLEGLKKRLETQRMRCDLLSGDTQPKDDMDRSFLAKFHLRNGRPAEALGYFRQLLGSEEGRRKLGLLIEGIRAASLAAAQAKDPGEKAAFLDEGLKWLEIDVELCRSELERAPEMIAEAPEELKADLEKTRLAIVKHLAELRSNSDLDELRKTERYQELFPKSE
jgi:eukaryotic-like serine/threonine-protein kinase